MENLKERIDKLKYQCKDLLRLHNPEQVIELLSTLFKNDKYYALNYNKLLVVAAEYAVLKNSKSTGFIDYEGYTKSVDKIIYKLGDIVDDLALGTIPERNNNNNSNMWVYNSAFTEEEIWGNAKRDNKIRSCEYYLNKFPNGKYVKEAKEKILSSQLENEYVKQDAEELALFEAIKTKKTLNSCKVFFEKYPHSSRLDEVHKCMELIIWNDVNSQPSIERYDHFIKHFPKSILAIEAEIKKQKMIEEGSRGEEARRKGKELEDKIEFEVKKRLKLHMQKEKETLRLQYEKVIKKEIDSRMKKIAELILANFKNIGKDVKSWSLDYSDNWNQELVEKVYREIITDKSYLENHSFQ